jgi:hypothetical protein
MFGGRYFGSRYFGPMYWGTKSDGITPPPPVQTSADGATSDRVVLRTEPARERIIPRLRPELPAALDGTIVFELAPLVFAGIGVVDLSRPALHAVEGRLRLRFGAELLVEARGRSEDDEVGFLTWLATQLPPANPKS